MGMEKLSEEFNFFFKSRVIPVVHGEETIKEAQSLIIFKLWYSLSNSFSFHV